MTDIAQTVDGRHERRRQNIEAVVDAIYDLWLEGDLNPGAKKIAERSGVSLRSVFRYFDDLDTLVNTSIERHSSRGDHLFEALDDSGDLEDRAARLAAHRVRMHEEIHAVNLATRIRAPFYPALAAELDRRTEQMRDQVSELFALELDAFGRTERADRIAAIEVVAGYDSAAHLRVHRGFSVERAERIIKQSVIAILG
ncbi:MAG: TetR/AcrR family transcriptional regulator [Acidimicrobiia bacterium]|nr:TetR/AcrR family transcriptional regulator [Acidimicrobiia bacterium]